jgi:tetratricopeptide (TPR) repeat protein
MDPLLNKFVMPIASYDVTNLPPDKRDPSSPDFPLAISKQLTEELSAFGANARIIVGPEFIEIEWDPTSEIDIVGAAVKLLQSGNFRSGVPLLQNVLATDPNNTIALFNLGMALSDQGNLSDAVGYLERLVQLQPSNPDAWIALGVAENRHGDAQQSAVSLRKAVELAPDNAFAYRNLGGALLGLSRFDEARSILEKASQLNPKDQSVWYGLGQACFSLDQLNESETAFRRVIDLDPESRIAEASRREISRIAEKTFRNRGVGGVRPDAIEYCAEALRIFRDMDNQKLAPILMELAQMGSGGLDIHNPDRRYTVQSLAGDFSALKIVCFMYVAAQRLIPGQDIGIDLSKEYAMAKGMVNDG